MPIPKKTGDIIIIGGGPAGLISGRTAVSKGVSVIVIEEHDVIGFPTHCAGLLSIKGLKQIGVHPDRAFIQNVVSDATFHSPSGLAFKVRGKGKQAYVVDRKAFDNYLTEQASEAGVNLKLGFQARSLVFGDKHVIGVTGKNGGKILAKVVIDAEGSSCKLLHMYKFNAPKRESFLSAMQFEVSGVEVDANSVEIFLGEKFAPGFFAWIIPTGESSARVGLAGRGINVHQRLYHFARNQFDKFNITAKRGGHVYVGAPSRKTYGDGFLVVGDAAGQIKPTTGGGVIFGGICAQFCGETAAEAVNNDDSSARFLQVYERRWKNSMGRELEIMLLARKILDKLTDKAVDEIFKTIIDYNLHEEIEEHGHIDFQSKVLFRLLLHPSSLRIMWQIIKSLL